MSQPTPDERLRDRLAHLPAACRALLAAIERQAARGGGDVAVRLHVARDGQVEAIELTTRYTKG
jgi:hypothetical protein